MEVAIVDGLTDWCMSSPETGSRDVARVAVKVLLRSAEGYRVVQLI